ncbi:MAG: phosphoribosyl transferase [Chloroflexi bacterium]|nr:phosphoribosyl transferase [Chloroflexota bacterium]
MQLNAPQAIFVNRHDAGRQLAVKLLGYRGEGVVVLAIPNGGVPIALEVASALGKVDFDLVVSRKIPVPLNPEAGFGAVADDGTVIFNEEILKKIGLSREQAEHEVARVKVEIQRRSILYKGSRPLVSVSGKTVIIVDDGLASGYTMAAAAESVRHRRAQKILVAVPVASAAAAGQVKQYADGLVTCAVANLYKFYISDFYEQWHDVSDNEVLRSLAQWRTQRLGDRLLWQRKKDGVS